MKTRGMGITLVFVMSLLSGNVYGEYEGTSNTLFGTGAGNSLGDDDDYATFIGYGAGTNTVEGTKSHHGKYNTFVGFLAGYFNTIGSYNSFLGYQTGYSHTTGDNNTFLGSQAGYYNTTGNITPSLVKGRVL